MAGRYDIADLHNLSVNGSFEYIRQCRGGLLNIVAIGKTGEGKSATLNTLIKNSSNPNNLFKEEQSPISVTKRCNECTVKICGVNCRLIDTIGLFDTDETPGRNAELQFGMIPDVVDAHKVVLESLANVISLCTEGIDAFLLVIDGTRRVTIETTETINVILRYFGSSMIDHCIFILTNSDRAATGTLQQMEKKIAEYLRRIGYNDVGDRFIHFNNKTRPKQNVVTLLHAVEENLKNHNGQPYTNIAFQEAQRALAREKQKLQKEMDMKLKNLIEVETDKIHKDNQQQMQTIQCQLNDKAQQISKLTADAVEERNMFQRKVNNLKNQMDNLEKNRKRDIAAAVQSAMEQCNGSYQEQFCMMVNQFQREIEDKEIELVKVTVHGEIRWTQKWKAMNRAGVTATTSSNGKYYCDRMVGDEKCCLNSGDNCIDCMDLDRKARSLNRNQLVNSDGYQAKPGTDSLFLCAQEIGGGYKCGWTPRRCGPCQRLQRLSKTRYRSLIESD